MRIDRRRRKESESGMRAKSAEFQGLSRFPLVQGWTRRGTGQPGAFLREPAASFAPPEPEFGGLHGKPPVLLGEPLSLREVAELIGCSPWTVRQTLIPSGLPFFRSTASGRLIFYTDQVIRWIESQQRKGGIATK